MCPPEAVLPQPTLGRHPTSEGCEQRVEGIVKYVSFRQMNADSRADEGGGRRLCALARDAEALNARGIRQIPILAIPAAIYRSAQGPGPESAPPGVLFECFWAPGSECPQECFLSAFWRSLAPKTPKSTQKGLFGALGARCPKTLKKHSGGHFPARAPEHSCKWRMGSGKFLFPRTAKDANQGYGRGGVSKRRFFCQDIKCPTLVLTSTLPPFDLDLTSYRPIFGRSLPHIDVNILHTL